MTCGNADIENIVPDEDVILMKQKKETQKEIKMEKMITELLTRIEKVNEAPRSQIQKWIDVAMRKQKCCLPKNQLLEFYLKQVKLENVPYHRGLHLALIRKLAKSYSGVSVISVLTSAKPEYTDSKGERRVQDFSCPHKCIYCPTEPGQPKSYLSGEPAVNRAIRCDYDTYEQVMDRCRALLKNGHQVDKVEYIVLGGTWSSYPTEYQEEFIRDLYYSANVLYGSGKGGLRERLSLEEEIAINETASCRVIGLTLETRPDTINEREILKLRRYGCTRVQLGVQHIHDDVLRSIKRGCSNKHTVRAIKMLKDAGFKVDIHLMPDLPGSTYEKDADMMNDVIRKQEYQVDHHKWYPTAVVEWSELKEMYERGEYKPWAEGQEGHDKLFDMFARMYMIVPPWVRVNRIIRDIPQPDILGGNKNVTMRQDLDRFLAREGLRPREIRTREIKSADVSWDDVKLLKRRFLSSWCVEYFISYEDTKNDTLLGFIRLRLPRKKESSKHFIEALRCAALVRELHVYGVLSMVGDAGHADSVQHRGLGRSLLEEAEKVAFESGFGKVAIIAGVGVREYYKKFGYTLADTYMVKNIVCYTELLGCNTGLLGCNAGLLGCNETEISIAVLLILYICTFLYFTFSQFEEPKLN
jgi:ELP3 family radical SAM enzyme/protein acetyltransferase